MNGTQASPTYSVTETAELLSRTRRTVDRWLAENASADGQRSHLVVGGTHVPVVRVGGRWATVAHALDAALRGEAVA